MALFSKKQKVIAQERNTVEAVSLETVSTEIAPAQDQSELVAVIMAAISAAMGNNSTYNLQVKSIKRQGSSCSIWNAVARKENLDVRF